MHKKTTVSQVHVHSKNEVIFKCDMKYPTAIQLLHHVDKIQVNLQW